MMITITTGQYTSEQIHASAKFLEGFLPKVRNFPGVIAVYHYVRPEKGDESTIIIWESPNALKQYRESELVKEAMAFEKKMAMPTTREAYPIQISL